ncbi:hypothetical protein BDV25DRAFT_152784 [Aspergillus avenaceus]|uniref:Zn(2)-C6 fungal-type domain-containing protein n=1 Tax=Aspergillus avenaceus TaxID=36643 RepID=A0A5N6TYB1_ASPAV|nr:hypothetical protein BDV25DRAFT_152784 [Aspergillus avenaceus]
MGDRNIAAKKRRISQRKSVSCTECTRRKLRCSKVIPCSACVDRGKSNLCHRRNTNSSTAPTPDIDDLNQRNPPVRNPPTRLSTDLNHPTIDLPVQEKQQKISGEPVDGVAQDAAITLEFLALGRQRVLRQSSPVSSLYNAQALADPVLTALQVRSLLVYHEENIAWMHNVLHMPTFRDQCNMFLDTGVPVSSFWLPLYYTVLSSTVYFISPEILLQYDIINPEPLAQHLHKQSIESLHASNFMVNHSLFSIQTICMLIHCGHSYGESDLISALMGCAIRIAQSIGLHRLGPDTPFDPDSASGPEYTKNLIDREVRKRVWWFLIRQDWLQIPFLNTYTIHATQFYTPMPRKCLESPIEMMKDCRIVEHDVDTYTQGSYTSILNQISVLLWKTQDAMCAQGHPSQTPDGVKRLYEKVIQADTELRSIMKKVPVFFRSDQLDHTLPPHILQQRKVTLLSLSHKFLSIHRHFQVSCFQDPWFSYTKLSCLPLARRSLLSILSLPENEYTEIARSMWTVNTHIVTATVALLFEDIFSEMDESKMFDSEDIRSLAQRSVQALQAQSTKSHIARKGVRIIESLLGTSLAMATGQSREFDLEQIISYVKMGDVPMVNVEGIDWDGGLFGVGWQGSTLLWENANQSGF